MEGFVVFLAVVFLLIIIGSAIWRGNVTKRIYKEKGYSGGFLSGFLFGQDAIIDAMSKKPRMNSTETKEEEPTWYEEATGTGEVVDPYEADPKLLAEVEEMNRADEVRAQATTTLTREQRKELENAELIRYYKGLLDCGAITQEEFDKKKAKLLNL